ncbi:MAG: NAD(P)/FAD-dependent oxidoreductase [Candidatus Omnitrophota bacterium]
MKRYPVVVIGSGPAGMMAALQAAGKGAQTLLLEKNGSAGNKLLITGGGRCNLTNNCSLPDFIASYHNGDFLRNAFARFFNRDLIAFFEEKGFKLVVEQEHLIFPASRSAQKVADFLLAQLKENKVELRLKTPVLDVQKNNTHLFEITTVAGPIGAEKIILATGGKSYPQTGSTGDGYVLAEKFGHKVFEPKPALCGIVLQETWHKKWQGISFEKVGLKLMLEKKQLGSESGEIVFTHFGISGPAALNLSRLLTEVKDKRSTHFFVNFMPELNEDALRDRLMDEFLKHGRMTARKILSTLVPARIAEQIIVFAGIPGEKTVSNITGRERQALVALLNNFPLVIDGLLPIEDAMVTRGGVNVKEINPQTMESRIVPGLYFAGEVIDVDGRTGGFNLQAAFSTGFVAGTHVCC